MSYVVGVGPANPHPRTHRPNFVSSLLQRIGFCVTAPFRAVGHLFGAIFNSASTRSFTPVYTILQRSPFFTHLGGAFRGGHGHGQAHYGVGGGVSAIPHAAAPHGHAPGMLVQQPPMVAVAHLGTPLQHSPGPAQPLHYGVGGGISALPHAAAPHSHAPGMLVQQTPVLAVAHRGAPLQHSPGPQQQLHYGVGGGVSATRNPHS